jgi:hypothetical protein
MSRNDKQEKDRRDPLSGASLPFANGEEVDREPVAALGMVSGAGDGNGGNAGGSPVRGLEQRPSTRATRVRPSEKRRKRRRLGVTFSKPSTPDRIRKLALAWGLYAPDGKSPNVSAVVEFLIMPRLEEAERGEIAPAEDGQRSDTWT